MKPEMGGIYLSAPWKTASGKCCANFLTSRNILTCQYDDERRLEIISFFRERFKEYPLSHWEKALAGKDVCWAPVKTMPEAFEDPLFKTREMVAEIERPGKKPFQALGTPIKLSRTPGSVRTVPPAFGQDTRQILKEMGYSETEMDAFEQEGVI
jgi:crotonobetainyl-CoA:carnitine CoA-transferase CaiB-like acyl-CoA transferase